MGDSDSLGSKEKLAEENLIAIYHMHARIPTKKITLKEAQELQTDTLGFVMKVAAEMGDFSKIKVGFWDIYFANHPDYIQHIFLDNWKNYSRETFQFNQFARVTGRGLLTTHGNYWQHHRRMLQPGFHRLKLDGMALNMSAAIERMHSRWDQQLANQSSIELDIDSEMLRLGLEIVGAALFSIDFSRNSAELSQEILSMMQYVVYRSQNLLALPTFVPTSRNRQFKRTLKKIDTIIYKMITSRQASGISQNDLLDMLLSGRDENNKPLAAEAMRNEIITMIIAGYETVATGMVWMWDLLGRHSVVETKIQQEINQNGLGDGAQALSNLPYTTAAIDEVFRLYPPSWLITRRAISQAQIGEFILPARSIVVVCPFAIHHHSSFWKDHQSFNPERWLFDYTNFKKFSYIPFGGGPHLCIGQPFARLEAGLTLVKTLQRFRLKHIDHSPLDLLPQVTLRPKNPLKMKLHRL
ncbi:MAG: cytochrome P450 [Anaerolineae bacterium]